MKFLLFPCKKGSDDLKSDIKSLVAKTFPMFITFKIEPSCFKTEAPLSIHFDAKGISEVTTMSSDFIFSKIHLSASSDPSETIIKFTRLFLYGLIRHYKP